MAGMEMPEWAGDMKKKMAEMFQAEPEEGSCDPADLEPILEYPAFFAEYMIKESDLLLHFFPRNGLEDEWTEGGYIDKCSHCHRRLSSEVMASHKPCPSCGHMRRDYIPGRREVPSSARFPEGIEAHLKKAVDAAWLGEVAFANTTELGAFAVQLQGAKNTVNTVGPQKFVKQICDELQSALA